MAVWLDIIAENLINEIVLLLFYPAHQDAYIGADHKIYRDLQQDCELLRIDDRSVAFKRKFDTCDPQDFRMHVSKIYAQQFIVSIFSASHSV